MEVAIYLFCKCPYPIFFLFLTSAHSDWIAYIFDFVTKPRAVYTFKTSDKYGYQRNMNKLPNMNKHTAATTLEAAKNGDLECLKYLHENGCPWDADATRMAAAHGHLECFKYLHENGCPWENETLLEAQNLAAEHGYLECLKYIHENGCPLNWQAAKSAATFGHLECLKYLHENGCDKEWSSFTYGFTQRANNFECLKYLHNNRCPWDERVTEDAAFIGKLECLKYLHENGCPWNERATRQAAGNGHLECLKYLHKNGCPWNEDATRGATVPIILDTLAGRDEATRAADQLKCLKYLHENGCPWNHQVSTQIKVKVWWMMVKDLVKIRPLLLFWQERTVIRVYSENGHGRKKDRDDFEQDVTLAQ